MANTDTPKGLKPSRYQGGACYTGAANRYYMPASDATAAYLGGLVKLGGGADANGVPSVTGNVSAGDVVVGVIVGFDPDNGAGADGRDSTIYRAASTERYVLVADEPNLLFEVQEDGDTTPIAAASVGLNASLTGFTSGSTITGFSAIEIDSDTVNTTATLDVSIHRLAQSPDNEIGEFADWLVRLNNHQYVDGATGV